MIRFMGMMPTSEIKISKRFKVGINQLTITIQTGEKGWIILYADSSSEYMDILDTPENNLNSALDVLKTHFSEINAI